MKKYFTSAGISVRIWGLTAFFPAVGISVGFAFKSHPGNLFALFILSFISGGLVSIPALIAFNIFIPIINRAAVHWLKKTGRLFILLIIIAAVYGIFLAFIGFFLLNITVDSNQLLFTAWLLSAGILWASAFLAVLVILPKIIAYFSGTALSVSFSESIRLLFSKINTTNIMEQSFMQEQTPAHSNRLLFKGLITGGLILLMLIPTFFIQALVAERAARQMEVVKEVSSKWAGDQTLSGPFLVVPYAEPGVSADGKATVTKTNLIVSAEHLVMNGQVIPEERPRSIYKVQLYRSILNFSGNFKPQWPAGINTADLDLANARLCFSLSDFKGIEEDVHINFNNQNLLFDPGLPVDDLGTTGLSVPVNPGDGALAASVSFTMQLKIKGSGSLHFIPMSVNSKYILSSAWPNPSFDGNALPAARTVKDSGFVSQWNFNRANLAFASVVKQGSFKADINAFGVSMVQPADQYNKTMRSVKYAILIIGLSFALFFIIEIMQKKPFHPVQYVLTGLALVIFYSLLLSISEYILFDRAYAIAATATVLLIVLYAKSHFGNWRAPAILGIALSCLYGFVFILISLEDTALLVGSIGLFIILALVMYASRRISWYSAAKAAPIRE